MRRTVMHHRARRALTAMLCASTLLTACGGGGGSPSAPPPSGEAPPVPPPPPPSADGFFDDASETSRFLTAATFGPTDEDVASLTGTSASSWVLAEFEKPPTLFSPIIDDYIARGGPNEQGTFNILRERANTFAFWQTAVTADDQLRQRVAFALSQLLVVSHFGGGLLENFPTGIGTFQDILIRNAFGNYRDLLEEVTYSPAMGYYLTYVGNRKADPNTGRNPDENYAREILQLFSLGVIALNTDGTPQLDGQGEPVEIYDNEDITGLAKVFTGLFYAGFEIGGDFERNDFEVALAQPMDIIEAQHSEAAKSFLGTTIPENTPAAESIDLALDAIMAHPNVAPFISRQLIQRLTTSDPDPDYIGRVASAFETGRYVLPDGTEVGEGEKGDLKATIAAVLFDPDAEAPGVFSDNRFGKVREPVLRITHWARAFDADASAPEYVGVLADTASPETLNQHPYRSPSVFNFYRPGYIAPGTESGDLGMTAPELQIVNASSTPGYINALSFFAFGLQAENFDSLRGLYASAGLPFDEQTASTVFLPDYSDELPLVDDPEALIDHLDDKLLYGTMSAETREGLVLTLSELGPIDPSNEDVANFAVATAITMVMSSPDYLVQQ